MKVVRCANGHWFDEDENRFCPYCGDAPQRENSQDEEEDFFEFGDEQEELREPEILQEPEVLQEQQESLDDTWCLYNEEPIAPAGPEEPDADKDDNTVYLFRAEDIPEGQSDPEVVESTPVPGQEPVVGWLVCVEGPHRGKSFELTAARNSIGRGEENRIILYKDRNISRSRHAYIIYEPRKMQFFLQQGEANGLVYLNGEYITGTSVLKDRDMIELGHSGLLFVALCGPEFSWEKKELQKSSTTE